MVSMGLQIVALCMAIVGLLGTLAATILPHWQVTAHVGSSIITATGQMRGLWMDCVWMSTGMFQCRPFYSILAMTPARKAAQAMMVISCLLTAAGLGVTTAGMKCTVLLGPPRSRSKALAAVSGGLCLIAAALCTLIPVAWNTHETVRQFYDPWSPTPIKYELGAAIFLGYAASILTLTAGGMLVVSCPERPRPHRRHRSAAPPPSRLVRPAGLEGPPRAFGAPGTRGVPTDVSWVARPPLGFVERRSDVPEPSVERKMTPPSSEDRSSAKVHGNGVRWPRGAPPEFSEKRERDVEEGFVDVGRWSPPSSAERGTGPFVIQNNYALTNL